MFKLLVKAPKAFWTVGLVQFFCWAAFMFMWTYTNGTVALNVFDTPVITTMTNGVSRVVLDTQSAQYQNSGRLGRDLICCPSHWFRYLGNDHPDDSEPQTCLRTQSGIGRHWIHLHFSLSIINMLLFASFIPDRLRMGSHAGPSLYHSDQCINRRTYGNLSGIIQWNYLCSTDCRSFFRRYRTEDIYQSG